MQTSSHWGHVATTFSTVPILQKLAIRGMQAVYRFAAKSIACAFAQQIRTKAQNEIYPAARADEDESESG